MYYVLETCNICRNECNSGKLGVVDKPTADFCVIGSTSDYLTTSNYPGHHRYHEFTLLIPLYYAPPERHSWKTVF